MSKKNKKYKKNFSKKSSSNLKLFSHLEKKIENKYINILCAKEEKLAKIERNVDKYKSERNKIKEEIDSIKLFLGINKGATLCKLAFYALVSLLPKPKDFIWGIYRFPKQQNKGKQIGGFKWENKQCLIFVTGVEELENPFNKYSEKIRLACFYFDLFRLEVKIPIIANKRTQSGIGDIESLNWEYEMTTGLKIMSDEDYSIMYHLSKGFTEALIEMTT